MLKIQVVNFLSFATHNTFYSSMISTLWLKTPYDMKVNAKSFGALGMLAVGLE